MLNVVLLLVLSFSLLQGDQKQGVCGKVLWEEGNQMPGPGRTKKSPTPVAREIYFYEPVRLADTKNVNGFFSDIRVPLVATGRSGNDGKFRISLPPGEYSVFTKETEGLFANLFDASGRINVVHVEQGKFTEITLKINYQAVY